MSLLLYQARESRKVVMPLSRHAARQLAYSSSDIPSLFCRLKKAWWKRNAVERVQTVHVVVREMSFRDVASVSLDTCNLIPERCNAS